MKHIMLKTKLTKRFNSLSPRLCFPNDTLAFLNLLPNLGLIALQEFLKSVGPNPKEMLIYIAKRSPTALWSVN